MVKLVFIDSSHNKTYEIRAKLGQTIMEVALENGIPRIKGECGGACSCGTCHVYIDQTWREVLPPTSIIEEDVLAFVDHVKPVSRLGCQLIITSEMDGMPIYIP